MDSRFDVSEPRGALTLCASAYSATYSTMTHLSAWRYSIHVAGRCTLESGTFRRFLFHSFTRAPTCCS
jgi:hypothetical protein